MDDLWVQKQFSEIKVNDKRLKDRAVKIATACANNPEGSLPKQFKEWGNLKSAYRFFSNPKITHQTLQKSHYTNVIDAAKQSTSLVLFIQDGSELLFNSHRYTQGLGPTADCNGNGLLFHSCLVAQYTPFTQPNILGLGYQETWIRPETKIRGKSQESKVWLRSLKKLGKPKKNWVTVGDRGSDIFHFLHGAAEDGWHFVVRAQHDRIIDVEGTKLKLFPWLREQTTKSCTKSFMRAKGGSFSGEVTLNLTWAKATIFPGKLQEKEKFSQEVTYLRVWSPERPNLEWLLITNLPINDKKEAEQVVDIYRRRWLIEEYHKALKTGCKIELNQLKQADRILALFGILGVIATQLLGMREQAKLTPNKKAEKNIPANWIRVVERYVKIEIETVRDFWRGVARMGGFLARKSDGEPGWQTIWHGYRRMQDMLEGAELLKTCG